MSKIKGWARKTKDGYPEEYWQHTRGKPVMVAKYYDEWNVYIGLINTERFRSKREAVKYAINYMRSHPNG